MNYTREMPAIAPADWAARGKVLATSDHTPFEVSKLPAGSTVKTMTYRSTSGITGRPTVVTGGLFLPPGQPPAGGWPVVSLAPFTIGVTAGCAASGSKDLAGGLDAVAEQLHRGYAVTYTDYVGLSPSSGAQPHPYLEPKSAAFNLIDSVRAARSVAPELSNRWVAVGVSQGGQAAWAAAEYFDEYGDGTELLGAAAISPALQVSQVADVAARRGLSDEQRYLFPYLVIGLSEVDPDIDPNEYLHGALAHDIGALVTCNAGGDEYRAAVATQVKNTDTTPSSVTATNLLQSRLASYALPQRPTGVPIVVYYGGEDETIRPEWTEAALDQACALGDTIERVRFADKGHSFNPEDQLYDWITDRFAGQRPIDDCRPAAK
jgi:pimeloyl-ACP methyl ester carboxylesterase